MWNITNVKSPGIGKAKRDSIREPIEECSAEQLDYLLNFASWIKDWNSKTTRSLTIQTYTLAVYQTCRVLVEVAKYMLSEKLFKYVLFGQFLLDSIEKRFDWYQQLSEANYFVLVRQVLQAKKSIRVKSLVDFSDMSI